MKKIFLSFISLTCLLQPLSAQRVTDQLDRGLIALPAQGGGYLVSWRLLGEEYYDVTYNVYRDGTKIASALDVTNFRDASGSASSTYTVSAVVRGKEQEQCKPVKAWSTSYKEIKLTHEGIRSTLIPNDACCADVDGDGELEILMKFDNESEMAQSYPKYGPVVGGVTTEEYSIFEVLKLDGTRLWWVNCGPNMGDFQNNEQNIVAYDWDGDGKAEAVFRAADGTTIHTADGQTIVIGDKNKNWRGATGGGTNWFMHAGAEYLVYVNGETGVPYQTMDYPLRRLEESENPNHLEAGGDYDGLVNKAWGDGYGHRSSKFFFGAPYLDGRKPSIFLARGIYTQIKMRAYDVDPATHTLQLRWDWRQTAGGFWMWQGYHNFGIADVDEDGRDEIVYGSMVVDDCGKGLSTTGFGHGDAQHCSDFNPYTKGLEIYACNEDQPGNNYRDATTSKIYHRYNASQDDGRAMMANFSDAIPGSLGCSAREGAISSVTYNGVSGFDATGINTNFRIYWDGDLCSETFNYRNGKNTEGVVAKYGSWTPIYVCEGSMTNNDTKGTPCYQGDLFGDWREEIIMRDANRNIRIYSTPVASPYRIPTLWSDHQYRNAMVWQMCGYNQPPHLSYFIGKLEGMTVAPPPLTMTGRTEVKNGGVIGSSLNDQHVIVCETNDTKVSLEEGAKPYILTLNVPSWVQGTAGTNYTDKEAKINYTYYTCDVQGGSLAGEARLIKQGDGILNLPANEFTHTGETKIWGGTLNFNGKMEKSDLWLNRFTTLNSDGGAFKSITSLYASKIYPGGSGKVGTLSADSLFLGFGSRLVIDMNGTTHDQIKVRSLTAERKTGSIWTTAGPEFLQPIIEIKGTDLQAGEYAIIECATLNSSVNNLKVIGVEGFKTGLKYEDGKIYLTLGGTRGTGIVAWTGAKGSKWDYATTENFTFVESGENDIFVNGDYVEFNDNAVSTSVTINESLSVDTMAFVADKRNYTLSGTGGVVKGALVKSGAGTLTINNTNSYKGGNFLRGGTVVVSALANDVAETGALGKATTASLHFTFENGAVLQTAASVTNGSPIRMIGDEGGVIHTNHTFTQQKTITGSLLTKTGSGTFVLASSTSLGRFVLSSGTLQTNSGNAATTVEIHSGTLVDNVGTSHTIHIPEGKEGTFRPANRQTYRNPITGSGRLTIYSASEKGNGYYATRTPLDLNLSKFEGTIVPQAAYAEDKRFTLSSSNGSAMSTFEIPEGVIVQNEGRTFRIGKVTGKGNLGGGCTFSNNVGPGVNTWQVGNDENFFYEGIVESNANFEKHGSGTMTVKGFWTTTGSVKIVGGTILVQATNTPFRSALGTGALTINSGATLHCAAGTLLMAKDTIGNSSVTINGTLLPNSTGTGSSGVAIFRGQSVNITRTGTLRIGIKKASTGATVMSGAYIKNVGTLTINGTVSLFATDGYMPKVGDEIRFSRDVTKYAGTPTVVMDLLEDGTEVLFDTSRYATEGVVVVSSVTAIDEIRVEGDSRSSELYNLNGQRVSEDQPLPAGIYVKGGKKIIIH